jgi:replicative DNA helicase
MDELTLSAPPQSGPVPPQALDAERSVLCAMLLDVEAVEKALEKLGEDPRDFYREQHRKIYSAIVALTDKNLRPDLITLTEELARRGELDAVGGPAYLGALFDYASTSANVDQHLILVKEKGLLRRLIQTAHAIAAEAYAGRDETEDILDRAEARIFEIGEERTVQGFAPIKDLIHPNMDKIQKLFDKSQHVTGVPTGFTDLDDKTAGLQPSDLIVIAGRPGMGKTSFALNIAENAALLANRKVGVFSLEMSRDQLIQRLLCSQARVDLSKLRRGYLTDRDWRGITTASGRLYEAPIFIDETAGVTVLDVRTRARRLKAEHGLDLLVIDYLQLMHGSGKVENRVQEVSQMTRSLKALAKELDIPIVILSQLSRAPESSERRSKIPQLSDLRESGAIEQDADIVLFIYREEMYKPDVEELKNKAQVIIAKHRNGPTGLINLTFLKESTRFENYTEIQAEYLT